MSLWHRIAEEAGFNTLRQTSVDAKLLFLHRFVRFFAFGATTIILAVFLQQLNLSDVWIGLFMSLTLAGDVGISLLLTLVADKVGRRRILKLGALLMLGSGIVFAISSNFWLLLLAAVVGVISPSGNEIGPFRALEESMLAELTPQAQRSDIFAFYGMVGFAGTAIGNVVCGWFVTFLQRSDYTLVQAHRAVFAVYSVIGLLKFCLGSLLTQNCESSNVPEQVTSSPKGIRAMLPSISEKSRAIVTRLCLLFTIDSFASGLVTQALIAYFFEQQHHIGADVLGTLFFVTNIVSSLSNLVASSISKRIGLVKTMVFTHLPSAIFLSLIPLPSSTGIAMIFLVLRSSTASMDQAPRSAFLSAVVLSSERTSVMGMVNVVKTIAQTASPTVTGSMAAAQMFWLAFVTAGALKASYDVLMLYMFSTHQASKPAAEYHELRQEDEEQMQRQSEDNPRANNP